MSTSAELDRFLADLHVRRQRLLSLVGSPADDASSLLDELLELSEQLLVADEELRVQQEELESTRERMDVLVAEWDSMFESSTTALVLTDINGVVLQSTRSAAQLTLMPPSRRTPRPIATWFEVADRSRVRNLISQRGQGRALTLSGAQLHRSDGSNVEVDIRVTPADNSAHGSVLRWELSPVAAPELRAVAGPEAPESGLESTDARPLADLTVTLTRLATARSVDEALTVVVEEALRLVPGAQQATVLGRTRRGQTLVFASSDEDEGVEAGQLSVSLDLPECSTGELRLLIAPGDELQPDAQAAAELLGQHVRPAISRVAAVEHLRRALETRQEIGQAVGVLVERHRITPEAAFEELVQRSQRTNVKLREVARDVVETGQEPGQFKAS